MDDDGLFGFVAIYLRMSCVDLGLSKTGGCPISYFVFVS